MHRHSIEASFDCSNQAGVPFYIDIDLVRCHSIEMLVLVTSNSFRGWAWPFYRIEFFLAHQCWPYLQARHADAIPKSFVCEAQCREFAQTHIHTTIAQTTMNLGTQMFPGLRKTALHQRGLGRASYEAPGGGWVGHACKRLEIIWVMGTLLIYS